MACIEIDQEDFVKALRLLRSRSTESSDELKRLLETYQQRQLNGGKRTKDVTSFSVIQNYNQDAKQERTKTLEEDSEATDIEDETETGACAVCKNVDQTAQNRLIECNECRQRYHQECHKPAVTKKELDTRMTWICTKCNKSKKLTKSPLGKMMATNKTSTTSVTVINQGFGGGGISTLSSTSSTFTSNASSKVPVMKSLEADKMKFTNQTKRNAIGKSATFSSNVKPATATTNTLTGNSINRTNSLSAASSAATTTSNSLSSSSLKSKAAFTSSNSNSFAASLNPTLVSLDKRFPNLKKAKLTK